MKTIIVDLEHPLPEIPPCTHGEQWVLLRLHKHPIGVVRTGPAGCSPAALARMAGEQHWWSIARHLLSDDFKARGVQDLANLRTPCSRRFDEAQPTVSVAVCTRNRASQLGECLDALQALDYPPGKLDVLVVDNAPPDESTREVVARYPSVRYIREPRPGLNWARNRAVLESSSEILAFTDDDVSVDGNWVRALATAFSEEPAAMCVTGLVVPDEIDTPAQALFERYGGFGRGFERGVFRVDVKGGHRAVPVYGGTGRFGTGANMAFRRRLFDSEGLFDPALDVGTATCGGGDLEMFFRVLKAGHTLVYEPAAIVRHRHRRDAAALETQIANNGIGFYSYLVRTARVYPDERAAVVRLGLWWLWWWNIKRVLRSTVRRGAVPRRLMRAELAGSFAGLRRYSMATRQAAAISRQFGPQTSGEAR